MTQLSPANFTDFSSTPFSQAPYSSIAPGPNALYIVQFGSIAPTVMNDAGVEANYDTSLVERLSPAQVIPDLLTNVEPVVIGPGGQLYLLGGTEAAQAFLQYGAPAATPVFVNVVANFSNLSQTAFWQQMEQDGYVSPINNGVALALNTSTGSPIPASLSGVTNDPDLGLVFQVQGNQVALGGTTAAAIDPIAGNNTNEILAEAYRNANGGLGLPTVSTSDVQSASNWSLAPGSQTTLPNVAGTVTAAQLPGFVLGQSIEVSTPVSNATLANGTLDGNGTFTGITSVNFGNGVTAGNPQTGLVMQVGGAEGNSVTLDGPNSYTGGTTILDGTLVVASNDALGADVPGTFTGINANAVESSVQQGNGIVFDTLSTESGNGVLTAGADLTIDRPIAVGGNSAIIDSNSHHVTLTGNIASLGIDGGLGNASGQSDLTITDSSGTGSGIVTIDPTSGSNPLFYGNWIIDGGTLQVAGHVLGANTGSQIGQIVINGGTFQPTANFSSVRTVDFGTAAGSTFDTNGVTTSFAGPLVYLGSADNHIINSDNSSAGSVTFGSVQVATGTTGLLLNGGAAGETVTFTNGIQRSSDAGEVSLNASAVGTLGTTEKVYVSGSGPALVDGIVAPWLTMTSGGDPTQPYTPVDFVTYNSANGFEIANYTSQAITSSTSANVVDQQSNVSLTANAQAFALKVDFNAQITTNGNTITLGDGVDPAGLIMSTDSAIFGGDINFGNSEGFIHSENDSATITSNIDGTNQIILNGGVLHFGGHYNDSAAFTSTVGTLYLDSQNQFLNSQTGDASSLNLLSTTLNLGGQQQVFGSLDGDKLSAAYLQGQSLTIGDSQNLDSTFAGQIVGAQTIIKNGTGTLDLSGMTAGGFDAQPGSEIDVNGGVLRTFAGAFVTAPDISVAAHAELQFVEDTGENFSGAITGAGDVRLMGGTLHLTSNSNTYSGGTYLDPGSTLIVSSGSVSSTNPNIYAANSTVDFDQTGNFSTYIAYNGVISDAADPTSGQMMQGTLVKDDSSGNNGANIHLTQIQQYSGATDIEAGAISLDAHNAIAKSSGVVLGRQGGGSMAELFLDANQQIGGLNDQAGNSTEVELNTNTLTIAAGSANDSFGGVIDGSGNVVWNGTGTLKLSGANTFAGGITINSGTVELANKRAAGTGAVTFATGANATLKIDSGDLPGNLSVNGFSAGDTIDLAGVSFDTGGGAYLKSAGVLEVKENGQTYDLNLNGSYNGDSFHVASDGNGGVAVTVQAAPLVTINNGTTDVQTSALNAVPFTVSGLNSGDSGLVYFTDAANHTVSVAVTGGQSSYTANLSSLTDGTISSVLALSGNVEKFQGRATPVSAVVVNGVSQPDIGNVVAIDADAAEQPALGLAINGGQPFITTATLTSVPFTVAGLDSEDTATVTFSDGNPAHNVVVNITPAQTNYTANLSGLSDGLITSTMQVATDPFGNHFGAVAGNGTVIDRAGNEQGNLKLTVSPVELGSASLGSATPASNATVAVAGMQSSVTYGSITVPADTGTVTITDKNGQSVSFAVNGNQTTYTGVNLSGLADGPLTSSLKINQNVFGDTFTPVAGNTVDLDQDAGEQTSLALTVNGGSAAPLGAAGAAAVQFTVSGLDSEDTGTVTFTDASNNKVTVNVSSNGTYTANLAALGNGVVTSSLQVNTDEAGNHFAPVAGSGGPLVLDQENIHLTLQITDGILNGANGEIEFGSAANGSTAPATNVTFNVGGLQAATTNFTADTGTVVFSDGTNSVSVAVHGGQTGYTANISTLTDGPVTATLNVTPATAGNTTPAPVKITNIDLDQDTGEQASLALVVNGGSATPIGTAGATTVRFTVSGLDDEDKGAVTFTDVNHNTVTVNVTGNGAYTANLGGLANGVISSSLKVATDPAGNSFAAVAGSGGPLVLDQESITPTLQITDGILNHANGEIEFGSAANGSTAPAANVTFNVGGLQAATTNLPADTGTVVFSDGTHSVSVAVVGGQTSYTANISTLTDGPVTATLNVTPGTSGNTVPAPVKVTNIDLDQDLTEQAGLTLTVNAASATPIGTAGAKTVSFTVAGLDDEDKGGVTFTDVNHNSVTANVTANGTYTADLSGLANGVITSSLQVAVDPAGNSFAAVAGNTGPGGHGPNGPPTILDQETITPALAITDGILNAATGNIEFGSVADGSSAPASNVTFNVTGLQAGTTVLPTDTGTVTFTDTNGKTVTVAVNGNTQSYTADISSLADGPVTATLNVTPGTPGNTVPAPVKVTNIDLDQDLTEQAGLTLTVNAASPTPIGTSGAPNVSFTVAGLDDEDKGTVTFTDVNGKKVSVSVSANGTYSANLSTLANGPIATSLQVAIDPAGNSFAAVAGNTGPGGHGTGPQVILDQENVTPALAITDGVLNVVTGNIEFGSAADGSPAPATNVTFSVTGLQATDAGNGIPDDTGTVTFTDVNGKTVVVAVNGNSQSYTTDLSSLADGKVTATLNVTPGTPGNTVPAPVTISNIDLDQDLTEQAGLTLTVNAASPIPIGTAGAKTVSFAVAGLDDEDKGTITFTDVNHNSVTVNVTANGTYTADLSTLANGVITSSLQVAVDPAGNSFAAVAGNSGPGGHGPNGPATILDQETITPALAITDGILNGATGNIEFGSIADGSSVPASHVTFNVTGLQAGTSVLPTDTGTVTFTDVNGKTVVVAVNGNSQSYTTDLSSLADGKVTATLNVTPGTPGNTVPAPVTISNIDLDQDLTEQAGLTLTVNAASPTPIGTSGAPSVSFTVAGLDDEDKGTVTFTDVNHNSVTVSVTANGTYTANLSGLANGVITSALQVAVDPAGNSFSAVAGNSGPGGHGPNGPLTILDQETITPALAITDGIVNAATGNIEFGSVADGSSAPASNVTFNVTGLQAGTTVLPTDTGTVTFTDVNGKTAVVAVNGNSQSYTADISSLADGKITATLNVTPGTPGNPAPAPVKVTNIDLDQDLTEQAGLTLTVNAPSPIGTSGAPSVSFTVAGLDDEDKGTVTFTDVNGKKVTVSVSANGPYTANLSTLANGPIATSLQVAMDPAGNHFAAVAGNTGPGGGGPNGPPTILDQETITPALAITDGILNAATGNIEFGSVADGSSAPASNVTFNVTGLQAGTTVLPTDTGTVTFTDVNGKTVVVAVNGNSQSYTADLSSLADGKVTATLNVTPGTSGNTVPAPVKVTNIDLDQDLTEQAGLTLTVNAASPTPIGTSGAASVSFTVAGLDDEDTGTVTFTDVNGKKVTVSVSANGPYTANLSTLANGPIATSLQVAMDPAGNHFAAVAGNTGPGGHGTGPQVILDQEAITPTLKITDGLLNSATGNIEFGSASNDPAAPANNVTFTVGGLQAGTSTLPTDTGTVTFTDVNGNKVVVAVNGNSQSYAADISSLADGQITATLNVTPGTPGNTVPAPVKITNIDLDQDLGEQAALKLTITTPAIGISNVTAVPFTVSGLDDEDKGTVTFTDASGHKVTVNVTGGQANYSVDLSSLSDGTITSSLQVATDPAGNSFSPVSGNTETMLRTTPDNWVDDDRDNNGTGNWNDPEFWAGGKVPGVTSVATIAYAFPKPPTPDGDDYRLEYDTNGYYQAQIGGGDGDNDKDDTNGTATANSLVINSWYGGVSLETGGTLTLVGTNGSNGTVTVTSGAFELNGGKLVAGNIILGGPALVTPTGAVTNSVGQFVIDGNPGSQSGDPKSNAGYTGSNALTNNVTDNGWFNVDGVNVAENGAISGTGVIQVDDNATATFGGNVSTIGTIDIEDKSQATFGGSVATAITGGWATQYSEVPAALNVQGSATFNELVSSAASIQDSGVLNLTGGLGTSGNITVNGGTLNAGAASATTINGTLSVQSSSTVNFAGNVTVNGAASFNGGNSTFGGNLTSSTPITLQNKASVTVHGNASGDVFTVGGSGGSAALDITSALTGNTGSITLATSSSTVELGSSDSEAIVFAATKATAIFDKSGLITGAISGLAIGDTLDLRDMSYNSSLHATVTGTSTASVLTVTNGSKTDSFNLSGPYTGTTWSFTSDGSGGTDVTLSAMPQAAPTLAITDGISVNGKLYFGAASESSPAPASNVTFNVGGLLLYSGTVTFTDLNGKSVSVPVTGNGGTQSYSADLTGLADGAITATLTVAPGTPATTSSVKITNIVLDQALTEQAALKLTVTPTSLTPGNVASVPFTIAGMHAEDTGTVTFTDSAGHKVTVNVTGGQTSYTANLSSLSDGTITSVLTLNPDLAGNKFTSVAGNMETLSRIVTAESWTAPTNSNNATGNWNTGSDWTAGVAPMAQTAATISYAYSQAPTPDGDDYQLQYDNNGYYQATINTSGATAGSLTINSWYGGASLQKGGTLTLAGTNGSNGTLTVQSGAFELNGGILTAGNIVLGTPSMVTAKGIVTNSAGQFVIDAGPANAGPGPANNAGYTGANALANNITDNGWLNIDGVNVAENGAISGTGLVQIDGNATATFGGSTATIGAIDVQNSATGTWNGTTPVAITGGWATTNSLVPAALTVDGTATFNPQVASAASIEVSGKLTLAGGLTSSGNIAVNGGTLTVGGAVATTINGALAVQNNSTVTFGGNVTINGAASFAGGTSTFGGSLTSSTPVSLQNNASVTVNGNASGDVFDLTGNGNSYLDISSALTGSTGYVQIDNNGSVELGGADSEAILFGPNSKGTAIFDKSGLITGNISGLSNNDALDLKDLTFNNNTKATFAGTTTGGVLTITNGTQTVKLNLLGNYTAATWKLSKDQTGGTLVVDPTANSPATGPNSTAINSMLEITGPSAQNVNFSGVGTLQLDRSTGFDGTVAGFGTSDKIDLRDVAFSSQTTVGLSSGANPTLTVSNGSNSASIALFGQYAAGNFTAASDGHGGTYINYTPLTTNQPTLAAH